MIERGALLTGQLHMQPYNMAAVELIINLAQACSLVTVVSILGYMGAAELI